MKKARLVLSFVIILALIISITGCSKVKKYEKQLIGTWYGDGENATAFSLYSDGTCVGRRGYYETGYWSVYEEDGVIKLTLSAAAYPDEDDTVVLVGVWEDHFTIQFDDGTTYDFWDRPY